MRAERDLDGGLDARMRQLEAQCPGWWTGIDRAPNLVVVMYSSTEREASVFYGAAVSHGVQYRWEHAVDEMGERFRTGDYTGGVLAGLDALQARSTDPVRADLHAHGMTRVRSPTAPSRRSCGCS